MKSSRQRFWPERAGKVWGLGAFALAFTAMPALADSTQISGGTDLRASYNTQSHNDDYALQGLFLNLRHVISDESGDRYILVGQIDAEDNFEEVRPYNTYAQIKGPLGKINLRVGHYLLPFGLLSYYDTERLLVHGIEEENLGNRLDWGAQMLGYSGPVDYALSVSQGSGSEFRDPDGNKLVTGRIGLQKDYSRYGFSVMTGKVDVDDEEDGADYQERRRIALDAEWDLAPWTLRGELIAGQDSGEAVNGGVMLVDYDLTPKLTLNSKIGWWHEDETEPEAALGFSYSLPHNLILRAADNYRERDGESEHLFSIQLYWEFSHAI